MQKIGEPGGKRRAEGGQPQIFAERARQGR